MTNLILTQIWSAVYCVNSPSVLPDYSCSIHTGGSDRGSEGRGFGPAVLVPVRMHPTKSG